MRKIIFLCCLFHLLTLTLTGQTLSVFDIDTSAFPTMKAKFFAFDNDGKQIINLSPSDFEITEDGIQRTVTRVSCPVPKPEVPISSVITIDVSGSMEGEGLRMAQLGASTWVNTMNLGISECAITSFSDNSYFNQDFTAKRQRLLDKISSFQAQSGTNYDEAFLNQYTGAIQVADSGKFKKIIIFLSDGQPNFEPQTIKIIQECQQNQISVFSVVVNMPAPQCLKDISAQTGGQWFENVSTDEKCKEIFIMILKMVENSDPCSIEWQSGVNCTGAAVNIDCKLIPYNINTTASYQAPASSIAFLECRPTNIFFKNKPIGTPVDTNIIITARNADFNITNITSSDPNFDVNPKSFTLQKGYSIAVTMRYIPPDSDRHYTTLTIENDLCQKKYYAVGSFVKKDVPPKSTLKVTHPNGGEIFAIGSDTVITWEGVFPSEKVILEFSNDNGNTWNLITDTASGLNYNWKNIPKPTSNQCLIRATHEKGITSDVPEIEWEKCYGDYNEDFANSIQETNDGGFIVAGSSKSMFFDVKVVKINSIGTIEWEKSYGGGNDDCANSIKQTPDGGYIFTGYTDSKNGDISGNHGYKDAWVVKLSDSGAIQWQKCLGGSEDDEANDIAVTSDDGYLVACYAYSKDGDVSGHKDRLERECWIVKLNSAGEIGWQKIIDKIGEGSAKAIQETSDGGIIFAGLFDFGDVIMKLTSNGDYEWETPMPGDVMTNPFSIQETYDGGFIVGAYTADYDLSGFHYHNTGVIPNDILVLKLNKTGTIEWYKCLGGYNDEWIANVRETIDGGYIVAGSTLSNDGDVSGKHGDAGIEEGDGKDYWIVKLSITGEIQWQKCLGGTREDNATDIKETSDGGFIIAGYTYSNDGDVSNYIGQGDFWIVKLSPLGGIFQQDSSDSVFSIVAPHTTAVDIDMKQALVGTVKDSVITGFITNTGSYPCRIDSINFVGGDYNQFAQVSGFPPFTVDVGKTKSVEFRFKPNSTGNKSSTIVIFTQADTLRQTIIGEGVFPQLQVLTNILDFGKIELGSEKTFQDTLLLKNISTSPINITNTELMYPDMEQFNIISGGGAFTLNPDESRRLTVQFMPKYGGRTSGGIGFVYAGTGSPATVALYGEGISDTVSVPDDFANFFGNIRLFAINPNPASDEAEIEFELIESARTQLFVSNILGEKVLTLFDGIPETGRQKLRFNTNDLPQGNYFVILRTPTIIKTQRIEVIR